MTYTAPLRNVQRAQLRIEKRRRRRRRKGEKKIHFRPYSTLPNAWLNSLNRIRIFSSSIFQTHTHTQLIWVWVNMFNSCKMLTQIIFALNEKKKERKRKKKLPYETNQRITHPLIGTINFRWWFSTIYTCLDGIFDNEIVCDIDLHQISNKCVEYQTGCIMKLNGVFFFAFLAVKRFYKMHTFCQWCKQNKQNETKLHILNNHLDANNIVFIGCLLFSTFSQMHLTSLNWQHMSSLLCDTYNKHQIRNGTTTKLVANWRTR